MATPGLFRNIAPSTRKAVEQKKRGPGNPLADPNNRFQNNNYLPGETSLPGPGQAALTQATTPGLRGMTAQPPSGPGAERGRGSAMRNPAADEGAFLQEIENRVNSVSRLFNSFGILESEALSPEAREAIRQIKEDAAIEVGRINEQITRWQNGISAYQQVADTGRSQVAQSLVSARAGLQATQSTIGAQIEAITGQGQSAVASATAEAASAAANAMPQRLEADVSLDGSGSSDFYMGGTDADINRKAAEEAAMSDVRALENLVAGSLATTGNLTSQINKLTAQAAESQLNLLGVTDEKDRLQATALMETQLRNNIYNLVQNRQDIERQTDRVIAGIERDEAARRAGEIDQFGLGLTADPGEFYINAFEEELSDIFESNGWEFNPLLEDQILAQVGAYLALPPGDPNRASLVEFANQLGVNPDDFMAAVMRAEAIAGAARDELTNIKGNRVTPGTAQAAALIFEGAIEAGLDPQLADEWANSNVIHALLETQSGGRIGVQRGGNLSGIGGLPLDTYEALGMNYDEIRGDPIQEMAAFLTYIMTVYGDPVAAASDYMATKSFGTIPSDRISLRRGAGRVSEARRRPVGLAAQAGITPQPGGGI